MNDKTKRTRTSPPAGKRKSVQRPAATLFDDHRFEAILSAIGDGISVHDTDYKILYQNDVHKKLMGERLGEQCFRAYHQSERPCDGCPVALMFQDGKPHAAERSGMGKDGTLHLEVKASPLRDASGAIIAAVEIVRDITEHKHADEALKHSSAMFAKAEEIARLGSWEWDIATNRLEWSDEVFRLYGLDKAKGMPSYDVVMHTMHPDFRERFTKDIERALAGEQAFDGEYCLVRPDGSLRFTRSKGEVVRDGSGRPVRMVGIVQDVTEQKQAELMVRNVLETVDEGFIIIDRDLRILSANRAYARQTGKEIDDLIGRKCHEISHNSTEPCYEHGEECAVMQVFKTGEPHTAVHTHYDAKKNPVYVETKAFPMRDPAGRVVAAIEVVNNISEKKKLEEQLRHAQKMEAVGLLAGGVAHDFNNILTAIIGYGNLMEMHIARDDVLRSYVDQILAGAARAANLTQSLLAFSRKQVISPRPLSVNDAISLVEKLLKRVIGEDIDFSTALASDELVIMADPSQVEQALMNLATNARDAMPRGGSLVIRTGIATIDEAFRKAHGFGKDGQYATIAVTDTGTGMDAETRERIFEPFFTTKELGRGTGLGLAIVYGVVAQNSGYVTVVSEPGKGSTFTLYFPRVDAAAAVEAAAAPLSGMRKGSGTILIAEDDEATRGLFRTMLTEFGYTVIEAVDGEDAVRKFSSLSDAVDLLVFDVVMPRKNGKEAFLAIRTVRPGIHALFVSGYHDDIMDPQFLRETGSRFLMKPVRPRDLLGAVQSMLGRRGQA